MELGSSNDVLSITSEMMCIEIELGSSNDVLSIFSEMMYYRNRTR